MIVVGAIAGAGVGFFVGLAAAVIDSGPKWDRAMPGFIIIGAVVGAAMGALA